MRTKPVNVYRKNCSLKVIVPVKNVIILMEISVKPYFEAYTVMNLIWKSLSFFCACKEVAK